MNIDRARRLPLQARLAMMHPLKSWKRWTLVHKKIRLFILVLSSSLFVACGASSDGGSTDTTDTVSTTGKVSFTSSTIEVDEFGPTAQSDLIPECTVGFNEDSRSLPYEFVGDDLKLNGQIFEYLRPLASPVIKIGVDDRLFAVWKAPTQTDELVTYDFEVEIRSNTIIYRNSCTR